MSALALIEALDSGKRLPIYFLYGEEDFFKVEMIRRLTDQLITPDNRDFNLESFDGKTSGVETWLGAARTFSFLGGNKLVVVRDMEDASWEDAAVQSMIAYTEDPAPDTCLILTARKADRKRKLFKHLTKIKGAGECAPPREGELVGWLKQRAKSFGYTLPTDAAQTLLNRIGPKPGLLAGELEKVITYIGKSKSIKQADVAEVVGDIKLEKVFALTDALKEKNTARAIQLLHNQLDHGEEPVKILGTIAWQFRLIWEAKHHQSKKLPAGQIAKAMGANPWAVDQALKYTRNFSVAQLKHGFESLSQADRELKSTGKAPEGILETLILNLCAKSG